MDRLVTSGLSGSGLLPIRSPLLVERYNECLKAADLAPTTLGSFDIDGKGWSPQIAAEKNNEFYLSHGGAVHFAIILTPDQQGKPVYKPFYSFERAALDAAFSASSKAIADLTSRSGIWLEIDPGIIRFDGPQDLSLVESVTIRFADTAGMMVAAIEQGGLVSKFRTEPRAWSDPGLRQKIIASARTEGDFRFREVIIPPMEITDLACLYAEAFGGTFVLRGHGMESSMLVIAGSKGPDEHQTRSVYHAPDPALFKRLFDENIVEVSEAWYREHLESLEDVWENLLVEALYSEGKTAVNFSELTQTQKKHYALQLGDKLPKESSELQRFLKHLQAKNGHGEAPARLSKELRMLLMRPHSSLSVSEAKVVWSLISRMTTVPLTDLYLYNKPAFFTRYSQWPDSRQSWAVEHLKQRGLCP
jgi:hypothetical protein